MSIPELLYKYRSFEFDNHLDILKNTELYFPSSGFLNDPFDSSIPFRIDESDLTRGNLFRLQYEQIQKSYGGRVNDNVLRGMANSAVDAWDWERSWDKTARDFQNNFETNFGVLSLSNLNNEVLMWSHYSSNHTGFCIGFNSKILIESIKPKLIDKMIYDDKFPKVRLFNEDGRQESIDKLLLTKFKRWEYEDEYRMILHTLNNANRLRTFSPDAISQIIFGCNASDENISKIKEIISRSLRIKATM